MGTSFVSSCLIRTEQVGTGEGNVQARLGLEKMDPGDWLVPGVKVRDRVLVQLELRVRCRGSSGMRREVLGKLSKLDRRDICAESGWVKRLNGAWKGLIG